MQAPQSVVTPAVAGAPPPVVVQYQIPVRAPRIYDNLACKQMKVLGIMQIICGIVAFIFNGIAIAVDAGEAIVGHGFWCGVFFIIAGGFALGAAKHKTSCMIVTCMVMSIIAASMTAPLLALAAAGLGMDNLCSSYYSYYYYYNCNKNKAGLAMNSILLIASVVEAVVSIWQSALCCAAVCCCAPRQFQQPLSTVTTVQYVYSPTGWQPNTGVPNAPVTYVLPPGSQVQYVQQPYQTGVMVPSYPNTTPYPNNMPYPANATTTSYPPPNPTPMYNPPSYSGATASAPPPYQPIDDKGKVTM